MLQNKLKELRARHKISQADLASVLGVAQQTVASWESGKSSPNYALLMKIAGYFHVSTDFLLGNPDATLSVNPTASPQSGSAADTPTPPPYYHDPEVAEIAQAMHDTPGMRVMFDASRKLSKESIEEVQNFIKFQLSKEGKL